MDEKQIKSKLIEIYKTVKITNNKTNLEKLSILTLIEYIKSSIDIIINIQVEEKFNELKLKSNKNHFTDYELLLRKEEKSIRDHISLEHQLKLHCDSLEEKIEELQKEKDKLKLYLDKLHKEVIRLGNENNLLKQKIKQINVKTNPSTINNSNNPSRTSSCFKEEKIPILKVKIKEKLNIYKKILDNKIRDMTRNKSIINKTFKDSISLLSKDKTLEDNNINNFKSIERIKKYSYRNNSYDNNIDTKLYLKKKLLTNKLFRKKKNNSNVNIKQFIFNNTTYRKFNKTKI